MATIEKLAGSVDHWLPESVAQAQTAGPRLAAPRDRDSPGGEGQHGPLPRLCSHVFLACHRGAADWRRCSGRRPRTAPAASGTSSRHWQAGGGGGRRGGAALAAITNGGARHRRMARTPCANRLSRQELRQLRSMISHSRCRRSSSVWCIIALYGLQMSARVPRSALFHFEAERDLHALGVFLALLFVTLPFVVRSVQPVLLELDTDMEEAARLARRRPSRRVPSDRPPQHPPGDPLRDRRSPPPARSASRVADPHLGQHPVQDRGRLGVRLPPVQGDPHGAASCRSSARGSPC